MEQIVNCSLGTVFVNSIITCEDRRLLNPQFTKEKCPILVRGDGNTVVVRCMLGSKLWWPAWRIEGTLVILLHLRVLVCLMLRSRMVWLLTLLGLMLGMGGRLPLVMR